MKTDPPKPRPAPQGLHRGNAKSREDVRDERGGIPMGGGDQAARSSTKTRLAIATFLTSEALADAVVELEGAGFGRDQVCIIGLERTIEQLGPVAAKRPGDLLKDLLSMIGKSEPALMFTGDGFILVACGPLWEKIGSVSGSGTEAAGKLVIGSWMDPATRAELTRLISDGAIVLSVNAETVDQQRRSARILLSHSSHRVQTHEFTPN